MPQTRGDAKSDKGDKSGCGDVLDELVKKICANVVSHITAKMNEVEHRLALMETKFNDKLDKLDELDEIDTKLLKLSETVTSLNYVSKKDVTKRCNSFEQSSKFNTLRVHGLKEDKDENVPELIASFINTTLKVPCSTTDINFAFRTGNSNVNNYNHPRPILINFVNNWKKAQVFGTKKYLKKFDANISIFEDLTKKRYDALKEAKEKYGRDKVRTSGGKIFFIEEGKRSILQVDD
ncbi:hypothetical protein NQ317_010551 [Molorchus minor]|uniref:Uncharacterized protein n=1 Tax=Molorchus minor TaxID=1323400 RepID=A0ABQ9JCE2_9CUCU|nr:hypothetical protein NQ317_010551 [Molorchus minor]